MTKTAVVLFNLGGPDSPAAVRPFLFNLFNDPAIITLPRPLRWLLAQFIALRRAPIARAIYDKIGGGSPLLANTEAQAQALEAALGEGYRVFVAMRYWHPQSRVAAAAVRDFAPEDVVLLPLYPQFSTTTTASSLAAWRDAATAVGLTAPSRALCCYPVEAGFIEPIATAIRRVLGRWPRGARMRLLFSAHGLPEKTVAAGDPYRWQVEQTVAALRRALGDPTLDCVTCYQSRVGRLAWIGPGTDAEIRRAGAEGVGLVVVPVAFVSEHSETLVELDIEYRHLAEAAGVPTYVRVPTVAAAPEFIAALARLVRDVQGRRPATPCSGDGGRLCPPSFTRCPCLAAMPENA
ncbi:MAG TPA: ferrochelatase [Stellaceae bacterium]|jgi:ferrochelatase|nr:ferrochelatase [Stellaceae bacterium]